MLFAACSFRVGRAAIPLPGSPACMCLATKQWQRTCLRRETTMAYFCQNICLGDFFAVIFLAFFSFLAMTFSSPCQRSPSGAPCGYMQIRCQCPAPRTGRESRPGEHVRQCGDMGTREGLPAKSPAALLERRYHTKYRPALVPSASATPSTSCSCAVTSWVRFSCLSSASWP